MVLKVLNYNKLPSPIVSSTSVPLCVAQRPLSFTFVCPNARFYIPNWRKCSIYFKNKVNDNIQSQISLSKHKGQRGVSDSTKRRRHFEIPLTPMWPGFSEGHENNINVIKDNFYNVSFSRVFQRKCNNTLLQYPKHKRH